MAFTEFYAQTTGNNLNAGSTRTDAATVTYTGGDWNAATDVFTAAVGADMTEAQVGRWIALCVDGDTAPTSGQFTVRRITAVDSGNRTITAPVTNGANFGSELPNQTATCTARIGGALKGPNAATLWPFGFPNNTMTNSSGHEPRFNFLNNDDYEVAFAEGATGGTQANAGPIWFSGYKAWLTGVTAEADDDIITATGHGMTTGDRFEFISGTGFTGLLAGYGYYAIVLDANTFKAALTNLLALDGTAINITVDGTAGEIRVDGNARILGSDADLPYSFLLISAVRNNLVSLTWEKNGEDVTTNANGAFQVNITGTDCFVGKCKFIGGWRTGLRVGGAGAIIRETEADGCNVDGGNGFGNFEITEESLWIRCWAHHSTKIGDEGQCPGFITNVAVGETVVFKNCISSNNGGNGWMVNGNSTHMEWIGCTMANNGGSGIRIASTSGGVGASLAIAENCLMYGQGDYGIRCDNTTQWGPIVRNCAFGDNDDGNFLNGNPSLIEGVIPLTADPFTDAANGDFSLNSTAGGGAAARGFGAGTFPEPGVYSETTVGYPDIGAAQHEDSAVAAGQTSYTWG